MIKLINGFFNRKVFDFMRKRFPGGVENEQKAIHMGEGE